MFKYLLILITAICLSVEAADNVPTEASIKELLTVTQSQKLLDNL
jgi:hypothetical protein